MSLREYALDFYSATIELTSHSNREQAAWALDLHILPALGRRPIDEITRAEIQSFLNAKIHDGLARSSTGHLRKFLHAIFTLAEADLLVPTNPVRLTKLPPLRTTEKTVQPYTAEECRRLLVACRGKACYNAVYVAVTLGGNKRECLGLEKSDIGPDFVLVRRQSPDEEGSTSLKTSARKRRIPVPTWWKDGLEPFNGQRLCTQTERNVLGDIPRLNKNGKKLPARGMKGAAHSAGLREVDFHSLRASVKTGLLELGCPDAIRDSILGHSRSAISMAYESPSDELKRSFLAKWIALVVPLEAAGKAG